MDQDNRNRKPAASSQRKNEEDYVFGTGGSNVQYSFQRLPYDRSRPEGQQQLHHQDGLYRCGPVAESPSAPAPYTMWTVSSPGASAIAGGGSGFRLGNYDHQVASLPPASNTSPPQTIRRRSNISTSPSTIEADDDSNRINVNEESVIDVEALMTKELRELTAQERNTIMEELHGVTVNMVNEECDATFVNDKLSSLDVELNKIKKNKQAYERALFLRPSYVKDRNFRLMFLRADEFDVTKAARRILNHFQLKLSLFGLDKLVKDITMDDLSDEDILLLKEGYQQIMPVKDRAGRTIVVMQNQLSNDIICHKQFRCSWYLLMTGLEDINAQKMGYVHVFYNVHLPKPILPLLNLHGGLHHVQDENHQDSLLTVISKMVGSLPFRFAAQHYCYESNNGSKLFHPALNLFQLSVGKQGRIRFRPHIGTHTECRYSLATFGIPMTDNAFPIDEYGNLLTTNHMSFLHERMKVELFRRAQKLSSSDGSNTDKIDYPTTADVILGRGRPYHEFPGNLRLAAFIDQHRETHQGLDRLGKTNISSQIVKLIQLSNGRFLKRADDEDDGWVRIDDKIAREKIGHLFREKPTTSSTNNPNTTKATITRKTTTTDKTSSSNLSSSSSATARKKSEDDSLRDSKRIRFWD